jgi:hypothetical protein
VNKYGAKRTTVDGIEFASKAEARRYAELRLLERAGEITGLECHPVYRFAVNGVKVGRYTPDFRYRDAFGCLVVEDVKGGTATRTEAYRLRARLMLACHGITVKEVGA